MKFRRLHNLAEVSYSKYFENIIKENIIYSDKDICLFNILNFNTNKVLIKIKKEILMYLLKNNFTIYKGITKYTLDLQLNYAKITSIIFLGHLF